MQFGAKKSSPKLINLPMTKKKAKPIEENK
jgi:hypothetical protein